jgi:hypothetical protein
MRHTIARRLGRNANECVPVMGSLTDVIREFPPSRPTLAGAPAGMMRVTVHGRVSGVNG